LLFVRELNLIPIERLLNKYLSTGEGKRKRFQRTKEIQGLMCGSGASADHVALAGVWSLTLLKIVKAEYYVSTKLVKTYGFSSQGLDQ
jgi:hypothetical protein